MSFTVFQGIDDGYWKGTVNGVSGMFPSIVVEEVDDYNPSEAANYHQEVGAVCCSLCVR